jgi:hypothetical protein
VKISVNKYIIYVKKERRENFCFRKCFIKVFILKGKSVKENATYGSLWQTNNSKPKTKAKKKKKKKKIKALQQNTKNHFHLEKTANVQRSLQV